jgi:DNA-binding response OmpR family regulator
MTIAPTADSSSARIVVADDEADIRRLIVFTLKRRGHQVFEASSGDEALALIKEVLPDLVVLDVMMPGLSGPEVTRRLKSNRDTVDIPVLLVSAMGQASEIASGLSSGASAYLVKPFKPQELAAQVSTLLQGTATHD